MTSGSRSSSMISVVVFSSLDLFSLCCHRGLEFFYIINKGLLLINENNNKIERSFSLLVWEEARKKNIAFVQR